MSDVEVLEALEHDSAFAESENMSMFDYDSYFEGIQKWTPHTAQAVLHVGNQRFVVTVEKVN